MTIKISENYFYIMLFFSYIHREMKEKIQQAEQEVMDSSEAYNGAKQKHAAANEAYSNKQREWRSVTSKIKRFEDDINLLKREIQKLEK